MNKAQKNFGVGVRKHANIQVKQKKVSSAMIKQTKAAKPNHQ